MVLEMLSLLKVRKADSYRDNVALDRADPVLHQCQIVCHRCHIGNGRDHVLFQLDCVIGHYIDSLLLVPIIYGMYVIFRSYRPVDRLTQQVLTSPHTVLSPRV